MKNKKGLIFDRDGHIVYGSNRYTRLRWKYGEPTYDVVCNTICHFSDETVKLLLAKKQMPLRREEDEARKAMKCLIKYLRYLRRDRKQTAQLIIEAISRNYHTYYGENKEHDPKNSTILRDLLL